MRGLARIVLGAALAMGVATNVSATEHLVRERLTEQPDMGTLIGDYKSPGGYSTCNDTLTAPNVATSTGWRVYEGDGQGNIALKEDGSPVKAPFAFVGRVKGNKVNYVSIDTNRDGEFDFSFPLQPNPDGTYHEYYEFPCKILEKLSQYTIK